LNCIINGVARNLTAGSCRIEMVSIPSGCRVRASDNNIRLAGAEALKARFGIMHGEIEPVILAQQFLEFRGLVSLTDIHFETLNRLISKGDTQSDGHQERKYVDPEDRFGFPVEFAQPGRYKLRQGRIVSRSFVLRLRRHHR
jgi:hypothetical protein